MSVVTDGDGAADAPAGVTFEAFARIIGKSRPYVSKLVKEGRIRPPALTAERKIMPDLAREQMAEMADPARAATSATEATSATYASQRARKVAAEAERAELDLLERRGELVERAAVSSVLSPLLRKLRDDLLGAPRELIADPDLADTVETHIATVLERTAMEILTNGGAQPGG